MVIRALEFYSGIGGLHLALRRSLVKGIVVAAYDWDPSACTVYDFNYGIGISRRADISRLTASELSIHDAKLWLLSPSCQPYTVLNPNAQGHNDPRAASFIHIIDHILPKLHHDHLEAVPKWILIENVAGFETSFTRRKLLSTLTSLRYNITELLLTPLQFGIPNSRLRYYCLATFDETQAGCPMGTDDIITEPLTSIPSRDTHILSNEDHVNNESTSTTIDSLPLQEYLDPNWEKVDQHPQAIPKRVLKKWGRLFDIVKPGDRRSCCFTRGYTQMVERTGSILQLNQELDTTQTFDRFLSASPYPTEVEDSEVDVILGPLKLRYFTPTELLRIFHFNPPFTYSPKVGDQEDDQIAWPPTTSTKTRYKLIGNSVNVEVVRRLIEYLVVSD
ncbi:hypothetical protein FRC03_002329 [Tulasnella sp. 419]|nr:hypothetical protein FRC03_002329 [Tulasnella sp. 419]